MSRLVSYLRQHHLGLIAIFLALGGTAIAAGVKPGSGGTINACYSKASGDLSLRSGKKCAPGTKPLSWAVRGPAGPAGATGPAGPAGPRGEAGAAGATGAPGSARAYGRVLFDGTLTNGKGATVARKSIGVYCVSAPGLSPATDTIMLTVDYNSVGSLQGVAKVEAGGLIGTGSRNFVAEWDSVGDSCPAEAFEVRTLEQRIDTTTDNLTVLAAADAGFAFAIP